MITATYVCCTYKMTDDNTIHFYNGVEHSIVGLSPQYWSYTPMLIGDVHRLVLVNGIDCILCDYSRDESMYLSNTLPKDRENDDHDDHHKRYDEHSSRPVRLLPVSRCELCGLIVNLEYRSNGAVFILLDDGTGLVDCISWEKSNFRAVPPLLPFAETSERKFQVGDIVCVLGKIKCLSVSSELQDVEIMTETLFGETKIQKMNLYECKREIQVIHLEHANNDQHRETKNDDLNSNNNIEVLHWLKCLHFAKRLKTKRTKIIDTHDSEKHPKSKNNSIPFCKKSLPNSIETMTSNDINDESMINYNDSDDTYNNICDSLEKPIPNGSDILRELSENTTNINFDTAHEPLSGHDNILTKRLFGKKCRCSLSYQSELLYCHCIATYEQLDPQFRFRDAVIKFLLHLEHQLPTIVSDESNKNEIKSFALVGNHPCLKFSYEALLSNNDLAKTASDIVSSTSNPTINEKRIYIRCLSALRKDGIIFLINDNMDDYVLLSCRCVLQPYLKEVISGNGLQKKFNKYERPNFLVNVPQSRLNYAEALITQKFI